MKVRIFELSGKTLFVNTILDMRRLYFLLQRVVDGLPNTANTFQVYLTETGTKIVQEQKKKALKEALANAVSFVKALMTFYEKYYGLVNSCFSSHSLFKTALDKVSILLCEECECLLCIGIQRRHESRFWNIQHSQTSQFLH